ncbi:MAG: DMT family transporter [Pseudomonadota bacterium]|nr:DMT family transporter [Pseudomonadota bacterium]
MIYFKLILATVVWGLTPSINKILSHYDSPFLITFFRFFFAAFIFFFFLKSLGKKVTVGKSNLLLFFWLGFFGFVLHNAMMVKGLEGTSAGLTSVIMSLIVVLVVLIDWVILKSIPSLQVILGITLSITGVYFVVFDRFSLDSNINFFDEFFIFLSALSWAIYTVMCRGALKQHNEIVVLTYATFFAVLLLTPVPLVQSDLVAELIVDPVSMLLLVFTGLVSSALTFFWHQQAIRKIGIVTTSVFLNLVPVFGVISASLILKEEINIRMAIGTIITVGGILIVTIFYRPRGQN